MGNTVAYAKEFSVMAVPMHGTPLGLAGDGKVDAVAYDTTGDGHLDMMLPCGPGVIVNDRRQGGDGARHAGAGDVVTVGVKGKLASGKAVNATGQFALNDAGDAFAKLGAPAGRAARGKVATASLLGREGKNLLVLGGAGLKCLERGVCCGNAGSAGMRVGETAHLSCSADILRAEGFQFYGYDASGLQKNTGGFGAMELEVSLLHAAPPGQQLALKAQ